MGVYEGNLQVIDVEGILEKLSNSIIALRYMLTSSDYDICISHYILHL